MCGHHAIARCGTGRVGGGGEVVGGVARPCDSNTMATFWERGAGAPLFGWRRSAPRTRPSRRRGLVPAKQERRLRKMRAFFGRRPSVHSNKCCTAVWRALLYCSPTLLHTEPNQLYMFYFSIQYCTCTGVTCTVHVCTWRAFNHQSCAGRFCRRLAVKWRPAARPPLLPPLSSRRSTRRSSSATLAAARPPSTPS